MFLSAASAAASYKVSFESESSSSKASHTDSKIRRTVNSVFKSISALFKALKEGICSFAHRNFSRQSNSSQSTLSSPLLSKERLPSIQEEDDESRSFGCASILDEEEVTRDASEEVDGQRPPMEILADKLASGLHSMSDDLFKVDLQRMGPFVVDHQTINGKTERHIQELCELIGKLHPSEADQKYVKMLFTQNMGILISHQVNRFVEGSVAPLTKMSKCITYDIEYNSADQQVTWTNYFEKVDLTIFQNQPPKEVFKTTTTFSCDSTKGAVIRFEELNAEDCAKIDRMQNEEVE